MVQNIKNLKVSQLTESIKQSLKEFTQPTVDPTQAIAQEPVAEPQVQTHQIDDELGIIFVVKKPIEGCETSHMIDECSVMDLNHKLSTGELTKDTIMAICKSSASANRRASKSLVEFHKTLGKNRKNQLKELKKKKQYWEARVNDTNALYGGEQMLDEIQKDKLSKIRRALSANDKKIIDLENLIRSTKEEKVETDGE